MPKNPNIRKVLVIGSGPIVIGQAAEFDYAGAQACRVLREEGVRTVLVNSNPATIMTDKHLADAIYLEPLTAETLRRIIALERPDGLLAGLGGQTGLTLAMQLTKDGTLEKYGVKLLGSGIDAIERAEDRERFRETLAEMGQPVIPSATAEDVETALAIAERIGYPVIVRPAYTLGGTGGGIAANADELGQIARQGLDLSPITRDSTLYYIVMAFLVVAAVEEGTKFFFLYRRTWNSPEFDYRFDGIVYSAFVSLGFAAFENVKYIIGYGLTAALPRAFLAVPGHLGFAVVMGYFYGRARMQENRGYPDRARINRITGYLCAVFLHGFYDSCAMIGSSGSTLVFIIFVVVMYIFIIRLLKRESATDHVI